MLRILFSILAIVAAAITLTIETTLTTEWWKYIPMGGLIIISLILWISGISTKSGSKRKKSAQLPNKPVEEETLEDFGILDIRPQSTNEDEENEELPPDHKHLNQADTQPESLQLSLVTESSPLDPKLSPAPSKYRDPLDKHILLPILNGFLTALNAHAIGILQPSTNKYEYLILGTAGQDWIRSRGESFVLKYNLLEESATSSIHHIGSEGLQSSHLTYSRKPASITALGIASIGNTGNYLFVDTIEKNGLSHPRAKELLDTFGQTFSLLLYKVDPNRPRHEIISDEMEAARLEKRGLALALVAPKRIEKLLNVYGDSIGDIEQRTADCLTRAAPESRVIKFGDLVYGVFTDSNKDALEIWHKSVMHEIEQNVGLLTGGVFIGVAVMTEEHRTSEGFRDDARRALVKAFQSKSSDEHTVII
ncbi:MAG: hypothetical protein OXF08_02090 [Bacteroidetes bacterium]|nr:hypothetical protein [Bacteroidota bacterium]MCY4170368.1 hypothetical protein [Bacteroidota bacterium]